MGLLIDRRLNSRNRNAVNRQRFLQRYRKHVRKAVEAAVNKRSITDVERGERVAIPADDVGEPQFVHGGGGERASVHPGNREFVAGDRVQRPQGGSGRGGGPGNDGDGEDDFVFQLTKEEVSFGTIGPSLYQYGKIRGPSEDMQRYTYGKVYNPQAYTACSNMPRFGHKAILTEQQMKDVVALLLDPQSPVNR